MRIVDGWLDVATRVPVLGNSMGRAGYQPTHLVMHGTAGGTSAEGIGRYFQSTVGTVGAASTHIIIDQIGNIVQCVPFTLAAYGNGGLLNPQFQFPDTNPNYYTISVEHCKASIDNSNQLTTIQAQRSFEVAACICDHYGIPKRAGDGHSGIIPHAALDSVNRGRCPGPYPWEQLWAFLKGASIMIPTGWRDDGTTLTAPNGKRVVRGFREYILNHTWDPNNFPREEEKGVDPVEDYWKQSPSGGTRQLFNYSLLGWTQPRGVYVIGIGNELEGCRAERDKVRADLKSANARITQLQQQIVDIAQLQAQISELKTKLQAAEAAAPRAVEMAQALSQVKDIVAPF